MTRSTLFATAAILAALVASPAMAQSRGHHHHGGFGPANVAAGVVGGVIGAAGAIATAPLRSGYYGDPGYAYYGGRTYDDSYAYGGGPAYGGPVYEDSYAYSPGPSYDNSYAYSGQTPYLASRSGRGSCGPQIGATYLGPDGRWYPCN
jgi:hypothetical protein